MSDEKMNAAAEASVAAIGIEEARVRLMERDAGKMRTESAAGTELTRLNATIENLYAQKCQQLQDMKALHAEERVRAHNDYERRHEDLMRKAAQAIRELDDRQFVEMKPLQELIRRLEEMRG